MLTGTVPSRRAASTPPLPRRSPANLADTIGIVVARFRQRPATYPRLHWAIWTIAWLLLAAAPAVWLDPLAGRMHGRWPAAVAGPAETFTDLGLGGWYIIPAVLCLVAVNLVDWRALSNRSLLLAFNWTGFAAYALASMGLSGLAVNVLKYGIGRARPLHFADLGAFSLHPFAFDASFASMPSGHATTMGAVFAIVLFCFPRWRYPALFYALAICATRVLVGAHYPSDVVAGFGFGFACAALLAMLFARLGFVFRQRPNGLPVARTTFRLMPRKATRK
jgi:undecaprenyl-diphosphatase